MMNVPFAQFLVAGAIADISIFMTDLLSKNLRSDMNREGTVNLADLRILTQP
jgi:hypothetical protein